MHPPIRENAEPDQELGLLDYVNAGRANQQIAIRACQTKRPSIAWKPANQSVPNSPRRIAGNSAVVTIETPPIARRDDLASEAALHDER